MISSRSTGLLSVVVFFAILLIILSTSPNPAAVVREGRTGGTYTDYVPKPKLPKLDGFRFSFHSPPAHKPAEQKGSVGAGSKWYNHWNWLNPFSSSITLDENRAVLPGLSERRPIYTFYKRPENTEQDVLDAEAKLLLAWRRAWFAQGFKPVVLGPAEAKNNGLYQLFRPGGLEKDQEELEDHFLAWMAWSSMGTGILADWRCFPMGSYDAPLLQYLRRGSETTHITRLENLGACLFAGEKEMIDKTLHTALDKPKTKEAKSIIDLIPEEMFNIETSASVAFYDAPTVKSKYAVILENESQSQLRLSLAELINSHLHTTFQNVFASGIAVLKPFPDNTTAVVSPGATLAALLADCPKSPVLNSCPPNNPKCTPCAPSSKLKVSFADGYKNASSLFTIGAIPHPYTFISLQKGDDNVTTSYVRRETDRDRWLVESTKYVLGKERGGPSRVVAFKDIVAGDSGVSRGLWFTVETLPANPEDQSLPDSIIDELDWHFGFTLPRKTQRKVAEVGGPVASTPFSISKEKLDHEFDLIEKARKVLNSKDKADKAIRDVAEAWNLADTEVWRFVRAYRYVEM
jgi:hypothetical protein